MARRRSRDETAGSTSILGIILVLLLLVLAVAAVRGDIQFGDIRLPGQSEPSTRQYTARSGITLTYPASWSVREVETTTMVATSEAAFGVAALPAGSFRVTVPPSFPRALLTQANLDLLGWLEQMTQQRGQSLNRDAARTIEVNGHPAVRAPLIDPAVEGYALAIEESADRVIVVFAEGAPGTLQQYQNTALDIARSVRYTAVQ